MTIARAQTIDINADSILESFNRSNGNEFLGTVRLDGDYFASLRIDLDVSSRIVIDKYPIP